MKVLDLFSGIGGFSLGLERAGFQTVAFCEIDHFCRKVLAKHWPGVTIHEDVKQLDGRQYAEAVDVVCGGYPCQPFSEAGKLRGENDSRHLWPEMRRIIREARPRWIIAENVRGHVHLGFDTVAAQMEDDGYQVWAFVIPACAVGAPHRRDRLWILGHSDQSPAHAQPQAGGFRHAVGESSGWEAEPGVCRVAIGLPEQVDRLSALGNAVVPQIPELIGRAIMQYEQLQGGS